MADKETIVKRVCVIDTETTGLYPEDSDVIQICVLPLDSNFVPMDIKKLPPFNVYVIPSKYKDTDEYREKYKEAEKTHRISLDTLLTHGFTRDKVIQLWEEWWRQFNNATQIEPLCQNYPFDKSHLTEFFGNGAMYDYFSRYYRDTYPVARYVQDAAILRGDDNPFPEGLSLGKLAVALGIPFDKTMGHNALYDCTTTAKVYAKLLDSKRVL